ncbi:tetratricopeptide repeat protein [Ornithinimicrobium faecis]|uniref:tetratricopeptide repeat protein n=1 Tax=Ornithinimicrobium faecis TaxID=2934158 RepID=UPI002117D801|nr:hypothetical protein [Ornithinimicrobium sp. HY1745]
MADETPDTPGPEDRKSGRETGQGGGPNRRDDRRGGAPRGGGYGGGERRQDRDGRRRDGASGEGRNWRGSEGRPRDDRGPRRDDDRRGGGYRGSDDRGPRRDDDRRGGGYRGHAARGGADRPYREDDTRVYRPRPDRKPEPEIPEHIEAGQLDRAARRELLTLSKENADGVARHLVASAECLAAEDLDGALAHAENASRRAGRVAVVREVLGFVYYRRAEWAEALREFRTARRLSGSNHLLPHIADVERGLGRPDRAIELSQEPAAQSLSAADRVELAIVVSGARRDLGQHEAGVQILRELVRASPPQRSWSPRLYYAYAESLLGVDDEAGAREWFARTVDIDRDGVTNAPDRLSELDGIDIVDYGEDEESGTDEADAHEADADAPDADEADVDGVAGPGTGPVGETDR